MEAQQISVKKRNLEGSSASRRMRHAGLLPGVIYGTDTNPLAVELETHAVEQVLHHHASETILVDIDLEGKEAFLCCLKKFNTIRFRVRCCMWTFSGWRLTRRFRWKFLGIGRRA